VIAERWVMLQPLDTITVRDGRPFDGGQQSVARTVTPSPSTVAGAVSAAYQARPGAGLRPQARGRDVPSPVLGPFVVTDEGRRTLWPVPADVVAERDGPPCRLTVEEAAYADVEHDARGEFGGWLDGLGEPRGGWWEAGALAAYLEHGRVSTDILDNPPWRVERRVGLAGQEDGSAAEGMLYSTEHLRLDEGAGFAVRCLDGPDKKLTATVAFGGRGRGAQVREIEEPPLPRPARRAPDGRLLLYLATPAVFAGGWRPDLSAWPGCELVTAAVGEPRVITTRTADRATGAYLDGGRLMWAAPEGSVYYLRFPSEEAALEAARALERRALPQAEEWLATAGFGYALTGSW
jgi:CRISPR/Cas system CMR-associated protein Cmr3 (group 5 of RAMP superfamily)